MLPEIIEKLTRHLSSPITEECGVVYLMVELRKLMDRQGSSLQYPILRLFCDWTVHTSIDRNRAAAPLLREFDKAAESVKAGNGIPFAFLGFLALSNFRDDLRKFLTASGLPMRVVDDQEEWDRFLDLYAGVVTDCPIAYTNKQFPFSLITNLTLTKEVPEDSYVMSLLGPKPFRVWMNWRVELNDGSVENWPFFN